jgi:hypothetical protein
MSNTRQTSARISATVACLAVLYVCYAGYSTVTAALEAEYDLHALVCTSRVVEEFVSRNQRWPGSWDELASLADVHPPSMYYWPEDRDKIERRVSIDFDSRLEDLAATPEPGLLPIRVRSKYYDFSQRYNSLFDVIQLVERAKRGNHEQQ